MSNFNKTIRTVLICLGALLTLNAFAALIHSNMHLGIVATFAFGVVFLTYGIFFRFVITYIPKIIRYIFLCGVLCAVVLVSAIYIYGHNDTVTYSEDAIIVLGSGIKGEKLTDNLRYRLDIAAEYYAKNPNAIIIVSGGMGSDEAITEAFAMERYLLSLGIPSDRIIKEEAATSTLENFQFSKAILDEYFSEPYTSAYVTSDYHIYRALFLGEAAGFDKLTHLGGKTPTWLIIPNGLRECMAIVRQWGLRK